MFDEEIILLNKTSKPKTCFIDSFHFSKYKEKVFFYHLFIILNLDCNFRYSIERVHIVYTLKCIFLQWKFDRTALLRGDNLDCFLTSLANYIGINLAITSIDSWSKWKLQKYTKIRSKGSLLEHISWSKSSIIKRITIYIRCEDIYIGFQLDYDLFDMYDVYLI